MREPLAVREKPRFNRAHRDAEAQIWCWVQQPGSAERQRAIKVPIEIDKYDPGRVLCSRVITANSLLPYTGPGAAPAKRIRVRTTAWSTTPSTAAEMAMPFGITQRSPNILSCSACSGRVRGM